MAPILKEADTPSATTTTATTPASPASKSPNETLTRPQPVPLEIPVTVNGARSVEGSDKREPFSETTQTVLVFPHGAVIRIATPLAPGQLVFLTNEKSKKEVVCQVVKSKTGGSANGYVELQFTEPAPAFWGLRLPGTVAPPPATAPAVPRPAAAVPPSTPRPVAPPPPAAPLIYPAPPTPLSAAPIPTAPPISLTPPPPRRSEPTPVQNSASLRVTDPAPLVSAPPPSPLSSESASSPLRQAQKPPIPPPTTGSRAYTKDIESLFAAPEAAVATPPRPTAPVVPPPPVASSPSTEQLKQQAARLQEQLSAMLFTEGPTASPKPPAAATEFKAEAPVAEVANKLFEIAQAEPKNAVQAEPRLEAKPEVKTATSDRTPVFSLLNPKDEEVEIPAWLKPLSRHAEIIVEEPAPTAEGSPVPDSESASTSAVETDATESQRTEASMFGGQFLAGEDLSDAPAASGSKKGLFLGLAAAVVLLAGGGAWYYATQTRPAGTSSTVAQGSSAPAPAASAHVSASDPSPSAAPTSHVVNNTSAPAAAVPGSATPAPQRNSGPAASAASESRNNNSAAARNVATQPEPAKKPSFGDVHLSTPVIRGSGQASGSGESLPSIDTSAVAAANTDALASASHDRGPVAPLPVGGDVKPAQLVRSVPPIYPPIAKSQRIGGNVTLDALIDPSGNVAELKVLSGPPLLHRAALDAVKQWKYRPAQLDGTPTSMHLTVTVQFRAQ